MAFILRLQVKFSSGTDYLAARVSPLYMIYNLGSKKFMDRSENLFVVFLWKDFCCTKIHSPQVCLPCIHKPVRATNMHIC